MAPLVFVNLVLQPHPPYGGLPCHRSRLRGELRAYINNMLATDTGDPRARMRWTFKDYLQVVVLSHRRKIVWPPHIPFKNLSLLKGGIRTLLELGRLLYSQDPKLAIRFEAVTAEEYAEALSNPMSMHPNPAMANMDESVSESEPLILCPSALHPGGLTRLGSHPTSTQPCAVHKKYGKAPRRQRSDVKRRHRRAKDSTKAQAVGTYLQGRRRPLKRGITSFRFILPETSSSDSSVYHLTDDPIDEFLPEDDVEDIEPASEGW
ncbi:hypothetical protein FKP32DRAFT_1670476 [Trametes sanguinea]|nr:hypothetical protein FKP32DRAFT_1670476 [Trametes sanguinea]